ncbi:MAG: tripartite transporter [Robiginitomaculum sp.]|nr:MAG: tripartite transporter [Robiginitomaculum sp.]
MLDILVQNLDLLMFAAAILVLLSGFPVAFTLAGIALAFAGIGILTGQFDYSLFHALPSRIFGGIMTRQVLVAVPLFVFMGVMLERSKIAEELLETMGKLFGNLRGGLGISVILVGALLAASTGIVGATVVTMGLLSLPTMLKRGYSPALASGAIAASGTLGQIIPPSIVLVLLGDVMSNAYATAQRSQGIFSPKTISVGDLFAGALLPGLLLVSLYILWVVIVAWLRPEDAPAIPKEEGEQTSLKAIINALLPPLALIFAVLGSILSGIATATDAAALGALGAILLAGYRLGDQAAKSRLLVALGTAALIALLALSQMVDLRLGRASVSPKETVSIFIAFGLLALGIVGVGMALLRLWPSKVVHQVSRTTAEISSMVFVILVGATLFSLVFRGLGGDETVEAFLTQSGLGPTGAILMVMGLMFALGFFLDFIEITFVVVPIVGPILLAMGVDPVWLGVMMAINLQTSFLTPPFGFALFYLRGVAPPEVTTMHIYRGVVPFVGIQILVMALVALFPKIATWLPGVMYGGG